MQTKRQVSNVMWTKQMVKEVIGLWESMTANQIADKINVRKDQVNYIASRIRQAGYKLPRKHVTGYVGSLIKEVLSEI